MFHGEDGGAGPGAAAGLVVDVLEMGLHGARRRATSSSAIRRLEKPRAASRSTSTSRSVSPHGQVGRGRGSPAASMTALVASRSSRPAVASSVSSRAAGSRPRAGRCGRASVSAANTSAAASSRAAAVSSAAAEPPVVTAAVEPFVVRGGRGGQRSQSRTALQHPSGPVGVQPDPFPVGRAERAGPVPHRAGHAGSAQVVQQGRGPQRRPVRFGVPGQPGRPVGQRGHVRGVADQVTALEVDHDGQRPAQLRQAVRAGPGHRFRLGSRPRRPADRARPARTATDRRRRRSGRPAPGRDGRRSVARPRPRRRPCAGRPAPAEPRGRGWRRGTARRPARPGGRCGRSAVSPPRCARPASRGRPSVRRRGRARPPPPPAGPAAVRARG